MAEPVLKHSRMPRKQTTTVVTKADKHHAPMVHQGLAGQDPRQILTRYLSDETTESIARDYGVTRQALGQYLLRHAEEDWKEAQVARAIARKEKAEDDIEAAQDPLNLAKARELLKAAQWDLERVCRRIYGQEVQHTIAVIDLGDRLRRARERVIDADPS